MPHKEQDKGAIPRKSSQAIAPNDKNYLLVIGIDEYAHCPTLYNAVKDAQDIVAILHNRFRFEAENTTTLYNQSATKANIYAAFRAMRRKVTPKDNLLVYFSGHGEYDKDFNEGYWIPVEGNKGATYEYIANSEIKNKLSAISSHHTFLMADSCFSGSLFAKGRGRDVSLRKERDPSRWGLTAGRNEIVTDGSPGDNSPFAKSILYQLQHADQAIGVATLCDKVLEVVSANANQTPRGEPLKVDGHQGGQFVFHLKQNETADWVLAKEKRSLTGFISFLKQYPAGKFSKEATTEIAKIKATEQWKIIKTLPEESNSQIRTKIRKIHRYLTDFPLSNDALEAENKGEYLHYKQEYLRVHNNLFALRKFARQQTPFQESAKKRMAELEADLNEEEQEIAQQKERIQKEKQIAEAKQREEKRKQEIAYKKEQEDIALRKKQERLRKEQKAKEKQIAEAKQREEKRKQEIAYKKEQEKIALRKKQERLKKEQEAKEKFKKERQRKQDQELPSPSFIAQYGRCLPLLLLIPLIWGISQYMESSNEKTNQSIVTPNNEVGKNGQEETKEQSIPLNTEEQQIIHPLILSYKWGKDLLIANIEGGKPPYSIKLQKGNTQKYGNSIDKEGRHEIKIFDDYRKNPGKHILVVKDSEGTEASKTLIIDQKKTIQTTPPVSTSSSKNSGTFKDSRDGQTYKWIRLKDGEKWMAQNLNYKTEDSWCYNNKDSNCQEYGRLYTWAAAKKACPSGWHLSSDDDWKNLGEVYGGSDSAYKALIKGGSTGFSALLGGYRNADGDFNFLGDYGYYLSDGTSIAWNYYFVRYSQTLLLDYYNKSWGRSCRCVQD